MEPKPNPSTDPLFAAPPAGTETHHDIRDISAVGDGATLCTTAIQAAIDSTSAAGGGMVVVPPGTWLSGTLVLKDHVTLHLQPGSILLGSTDLADYPEMIPAVRSFIDRQCRRSLIYAEGREHIAITGSGTIDGNGGAFPQEHGEGIDYERPYLLRAISCRDLCTEGVHLCNSAMWMQHYLCCERVELRGLNIENHCNYNNDGIDIDGCRDVTISDCQIDTDDDALCLKSSQPQATENVMVSNCVLRSHCTAIKLGTESNGGFRNVTISDCTIHSPSGDKPFFGYVEGRCGIALETVDGGHLEDVDISDITIDGVAIPFFMRLGNRARPHAPNAPKPGVGSFHKVVLSNITATGAGKVGCAIAGIPGHPIEDVSLRDLRLEFAGGGTKDDAEREIPKREDAYPEGDMFGTLPAFGIYARHVRNLRMENVQLVSNTADARPETAFDDVE